jgi:ABC-type amino acid transport substrate-binding protein
MSRSFGRCVAPIVMAALALASCDQHNGSTREMSALDRIQSSHLVRVGYIVFPPAIIKNPQSGQLGGHFVDVMNEIASQSGWKVQYTETDWASFPAGLNSRRFDISIAPTFSTIPRALAVSFTHPLIYAGNSAIARKGDQRFTDIESLDRPGVRISVTAGEAGHEYAIEHFSRAKVIVHQGADEMLTFSEVLAGRADVALGDAYITSQYAATHRDEIQDLFASKPYNLTPVAWSVARGEPELLTFLNTSIDTLETQGKLQEYEMRYHAHWLHLLRTYRSE